MMEFSRDKIQSKKIRPGPRQLRQRLPRTIDDLLFRQLDGIDAGRVVRSVHWLRGV